MIINDYFTNPKRYPIKEWDMNQTQDLKKLLDAAKRFDKTTDQPDCHEENGNKPLLTELEKMIDDRLSALEKRLENLENQRN